jgi:hypothetical protein
MNRYDILLEKPVTDTSMRGVPADTEAYNGPVLPKKNFYNYCGNTTCIDNLKNVCLFVGPCPDYVGPYD